MARNEAVRQMQRAMARHALYFFSWFFHWIPYSVMRGIAYIFVQLGFLFLIGQKRIARESLEIAFGKEKSPQEIKNILRKCFDHLGRGMVEMLYFMAHPQMIGKKVTFEGWEHLEEAIARGKGVIAVSAHFGNFPLMMFSLAKKGYPVNAIIRPARDPILEKDLLRRRTEEGLKNIYAIPRKECVEQCIRALRHNEILFILLDQNFGNGRGVFVDFFGEKAATGTGPVVFSSRTGATILPMFIIREEGDYHRVIIEPIFELEQGVTDEEILQKNVQRITDIIERYIRKYPHEWGWMHRRWKTKPDQEKKNS
ncbi:MAG TPA: lysophospholipid acyltransferase family protein [Candidatus Omnitrophota bacterium]|nr:lysophospholipid acyltransferase family protein [Candidatus Omnitrophota bacterium]HPN88582.1 lysophospholipid acyltransferase family protein [Candidatus Omnitrophota bacterium]